VSTTPLTTYLKKTMLQNPNVKIYTLIIITRGKTNTTVSI